MRIFQRISPVLGFLATLIVVACEQEPKTNVVRDTVVVNVPDTTAAIVSDSLTAITDPSAIPVTLPVLDAFFADSTFTGELRQKLSLTDAQIDSLRRIAREETSKLRESPGGEYSGSTDSARRLAAERIRGVIGDQKALQLAQLLRERWGEGVSVDSMMAAKPNTVPSDTRIVVNAPAYRLDVFEHGKLVRTFKIGVGYPEFPLPSGMRTARTIIFNPTWTPPDEPWVESSKEVKVGELVKAGDKRNPLGIAKIPIGLPSLIHGGKSEAQLGGFASHGCAGLTDQQIREFSLLVAEISGTKLSDSAIKAYGRKRTETQEIKLAAPMLVELRYETIVVQDGKLYIYRDIYDHNTNTEENLRTVLGVYGVTMEQLTPEEQSQVRDALAAMSRDAKGRSDSAAAQTPPQDSAASGAKGKAKQPKITKSMKGKKEMVIEIAALKGKGYPTPVTTTTRGKDDQQVKSRGTTI